ncbi:MAG TPA: class I SAM-dependent methyltransferase [Acidimicrobiales bacterium]|nr:class I SAM-dependent methyltransferase [Acidimicrobiales bacterium]
MLHEERRRAEAFGEYAEQYDRSRPTYPSELVDWVCPTGGRRVLDVGCGTGKAAVLFAARDCEVLGIEIDQRMAAIAQDRGIPVEVASFEKWDAAGRSFDLVVSGQAWHWVDPNVGPARAADVLTSNGRLAAFWNYEYTSDEALGAAVEAAYETFAPDLEGSGIGRHNTRRHESQTADHVASIENCGRFASCSVKRFPWAWELRPEEFLDLVRTHSGVAILPEKRRELFLDRLADAASARGNTISLACEAVCIVADKAKSR